LDPRRANRNVFGNLVTQIMMKSEWATRGIRAEKRWQETWGLKK